jgi:CubicO group peptidase (beta-lactamase class C family)
MYHSAIPLVRLRRLTAVLLFVFAITARAVDPAAAGFDADRLGRLDRAILAEIDQKRLAGGVMFIARDGRVVKLQAYGQQDIAAGRPMPPDAIFRIASMSKAITTVAALMLYEEGRFMLNDPVGKYIPAFAKSEVAVPPPVDAPAGTKYVKVPAKSPITIRQLMTHTAGLTYGVGNNPAAAEFKQANVRGWYFADKDESVGETMQRLAKLPLAHHPGEAYDYGFGTDLLGHLVEVVSGMPLDKFIATRITGPLKMPDTCFFLPPEKAGRLATVYGVTDGVLAPGDQGLYVTGPRKCFSGGAGLLSTATDYGRFLQMLLNGGELDGVRLLGPKTVDLMHANHVGDLHAGGRQSFGLGFWVNDRPGRFGELAGEGSYGWGSAYFPQYVVDPKERLVFLFMTQLLPNGGNDLNQRMKVLTYQALIK